MENIILFFAIMIIVSSPMVAHIWFGSRAGTLVSFLDFLFCLDWFCRLWSESVPKMGPACMIAPAVLLLVFGWVFVTSVQILFLDSED